MFQTLRYLAIANSFDEDRPREKEEAAQIQANTIWPDVVLEFHTWLKSKQQVPDVLTLRKQLEEPVVEGGVFKAMSDHAKWDNLFAEFCSAALTAVGIRHTLYDGRRIRFAAYMPDRGSLGDVVAHKGKFRYIHAGRNGDFATGRVDSYDAAVKALEGYKPQAGDLSTFIMLDE